MGQMISLTAADGHALSAYSSGPGDASAGLVVVQEIFGVNHYIRSMCDRFAAEGYRVVAPALFDRVRPGVELGYGQQDIAEGIKLRQNLQDGDALADVAAAAAHLTGARIGIVGYCYGGAVAWWGATRTPLFGAASCWYGGGIAGTKDERPNCPVQMHFGGMDQSIPPDDVDAIRKAQPGVEVHVYPDAQHGFGCDERPSFSRPDYELAQSRTLAFFAQYLRS